LTKKVSNDTRANKRDANSKGRPAHKELSGKIERARTIFRSHGYTSAEPAKLMANFIDLDLFLQEEQIQAVEAALMEVAPEHYAGAYPPLKSYEPATQKKELFAFCWESQYFRKTMYLKFCLGETRLYIFSLHQSAPKRSRR
jgi:hypothetical protein